MAQAYRSYENITGLFSPSLNEHTGLEDRQCIMQWHCQKKMEIEF